MGHENLDQINHEGEENLNMLGWGELADQPIPSRPDLKWREFMQICGDHARPVFTALKTLSPDDPSYIEVVNELKNRVRSLTELENPEA